MKGKRLGLFITCVLLAPLMLLIQHVSFGTTQGFDLAIVLACAAGWLAGWPISGVIGFSIGLIQDLFVGRVIGFSTLSLSVVSMSMSWIRGFLNPSMAFSSSIAAMISTGLGDLVSYAVLRLSKTPLSLSFFIREILPYSLLWSFILVVPVNSIVKGISGMLAMLWPNGKEQEAGRIGYESRL